MASKTSFNNDSFSECQICLEDMQGKSPRALSCLHTYCQTCLVDLLRSLPPQNPFHFRWDASEIKCPTCRKTTILGADGIKGLPINFMINKAEEEKGECLTETLCQNCGKGSPVVRCKDCDSCLCENCNRKHGDIGAFKSHQIVLINDSKKIEHICLDHKKEANYVCLKCECLVCMKCVLSEKHEGHSDDIKEYSSWASSEKSKIACYRETITPIWLNIKERLRKANNLSENLAETLKQVKKTAAMARDFIGQQEEIYTRELYSAKDKSSSLIRHLKGLGSNADNFMQLSIQLQSSDSSNFQSIKSMASLATCVIDSVSILPNSDELYEKPEFIPCNQWSIGTLKRKEQL